MDRMHCHIGYIPRKEFLQASLEGRIAPAATPAVMSVLLSSMEASRRILP
jgi:hypothetical protein